MARRNPTPAAAPAIYLIYVTPVAQQYHILVLPIHVPQHYACSTTTPAARYLQQGDNAAKTKPRAQQQQADESEQQQLLWW